MTVVPTDFPPNGVIIRTPRLVMHPINRDDWPNYSPTYGDSDPMRHLGGAWSTDLMAINAAKNHNRWARQGCASWLVDFRNDDGTIDLNVALLGFGDFRDSDEVGFGWIVAPSHHRRGISTEASRAALDWFFERFPGFVVLTETIPENQPSISMSRRLGFKYRSSDPTEHVCELSAQQWHEARLDISKGQAPGLG